jgi:hypothetical protein
MKKTLLVSSLIAATLFSPSYAAIPIKHITVNLTHVTALTVGGNLQPELKQRCMNEYGSYLFTPMIVDYQINPGTLVEKVWISLWGQDHFPLLAEGISNKYNFTSPSFGYSPLINKRVISIFVTINKSFNHETAMLLLEGGKDDQLGEYNCALTGEQSN